MAVSSYVAIENGIFVFYTNGSVTTDDCVLMGLQLAQAEGYNPTLMELTNSVNDFIDSSCFGKSKIYLYPTSPYYSEEDTGEPYNLNAYSVVWAYGSVSYAKALLNDQTSRYVRAIASSSTQAVYASNYYEHCYNKPSATQLTTPTNLIVSEYSTELLLVWDPVTNATGYTVSYKLSTASTWTTATTTAPSYTLSNLPTGVTYQFKVKATSTNSDYIDSAESAVVSGTTKPKLATPTGLSVTATTTSLTFSWDPVTNARYYYIYYKLSTADTWSGDVTSATSYTLSNLSSGVTCQLAVVATSLNSDYADSEATAVVSGTITMQLATPTGVIVSEITSSGAKIGWNAVTNASGYKIEYRAAGATNWQEENV